jgi:hypothetical protein
MKQIKLTKGMFALVDDADYDALNKHKWYAHRNWKTFYAERKCNGISILMHQVIIGKPPIGKDTDHKDGDGLNNQRYNLSHITHRENCQNIKGKSNLAGVTKKGNKWQSQIRINGDKIYLGIFCTQELAAKAYQEAKP